VTHDVATEQLSALKFERVWVRQAEFLDASAEHGAMPGDWQCKINLEVKVDFVEKERAFVLVRVTLESPPQQRLFDHLVAAVEGEFSIRPSIDPPIRALHSFASLQAPVLLLPYVRQVLTTLTAQARCGAIVIPPINMAEVTKALHEGVSVSQAGPRQP
jgi:preprotein translocase subunit SecB